MSDLTTFRFACECDVSRNIGLCRISEVPEFEDMTRAELEVYAKEQLMTLNVGDAHLQYALVQSERKDGFKALLEKSYKLDAQIVHDLRARVKELEEEARNPPPVSVESPFSAMMSFTSPALLKKLEAENAKLREERGELKEKLGGLRALVDQQSKFGACLSPEDAEKLAARLERKEAVDHDLLKGLIEQRSVTSNQYEKLYPKMVQEHRQKIADLKAQVKALTESNQDLQARTDASLKDSHLAAETISELNEVVEKAKALHDNNHTYIDNLKATLQKSQERYEEAKKENQTLVKRCEDYRSACQSLNAKSEKITQDKDALISKANAEAAEAKNALQHELSRAKQEVSWTRPGSKQIHRRLSYKLSPSNMPLVGGCGDEACPHTIVSLMTKEEHEKLQSNNPGVPPEYNLIGHVRDVVIGKMNSKMKEIQIQNSAPVPRKRSAAHAGRPSSTLSNRFNQPSGAVSHAPTDYPTAPRLQADPNYNSSNVYANRMEMQRTVNMVPQNQTASPVQNPRLRQMHPASSQPMTQLANGRYGPLARQQSQCQSEGAAVAQTFPALAQATPRGNLSGYTSGPASNGNFQGHPNQTMLHEAAMQQNRLVRESTASQQGAGFRQIEFSAIGNVNSPAVPSGNTVMAPHLPSQADSRRPTTARKGPFLGNTNTVHFGQQQNFTDGPYTSAPRHQNRTSMVSHNFNSVSDYSPPHPYDYVGPQQQIYPEYANQYSAQHVRPVQAVPGFDPNAFSPVPGSYLSGPLVPDPSFNYDGAYQDILGSTAFAAATAVFDSPVMPGAPGFQQGQKRPAPSSSPYNSDRAGPRARFE